MAGAAPPRPRWRGRRWLVVLGVLAILALGVAWFVNRQLEPTRLTATVLDRVGKALQLQIGFEGMPEYALRPEPRLLLPGLRVAGLDGKPFLTAARAEISLPWATITGDEPVITRLQIEQPVLDLAGLQRWIAARPPTPFKLPTLTHGLQVYDGTLVGAGFVVRALSLELPTLRTGDPADLAANGRLEMGDTRLGGQLSLHLDTPGLASPYKLGFAGTLQQSPKPLAFRLDAVGRFASTDASFSLDADTLSLAGDSPLPHLAGMATLRSAKTLQLDFSGLLRDWPAVWPRLPEPLASQTTNLPVIVTYAGRNDLSDPLALRVAKPPTTLDATLRVPELRAWLLATTTSPLPPIAGTLKTPVLAFDGITLEGVEAEVRAE